MKHISEAMVEALDGLIKRAEKLQREQREQAAAPAAETVRNCTTCCHVFKASASECPPCARSGCFSGWAPMARMTRAGVPA